MPTKVLLSIKPRFAEAILSGGKTYEFRRALFKSRDVTSVVIYASSPIQRVVGEFSIEEVLCMDVEDLWAATQCGGGIEREYFDAYFAGREAGFALKVRNVTKYKRPLDLKKDFGVKRPPQSFQYLA